MRVARMIRLTLAFAGAALVVFHGWLFANQMAAGRLEDPWLMFRWVSAALLGGALIAAWRGESTVFGRKSVAVWVLAALLHGPAISDRTDFNSFALPETVATTIVQVLSSAALSAGLVLLAALLFAIRRTTATRYSFVPVEVRAGGRGLRISRHFSPRPPPLRRE